MPNVVRQAAMSLRHPTALAPEQRQPDPPAETGLCKGCPVGRRTSAVEGDAATDNLPF